MATLLVTLILLIPVACWGLIAPLSDLISAFKAARPRTKPNAPDPVGLHRLLVLIPAHDESLLIERCVHSLLAAPHAADAVSVVVVADNCADDTADRAERAGAIVVSRRDAVRRGKGYAIEWALGQVALPRYDAVLIVDADTTIPHDFYESLASWEPLVEKAIQCYDGMGNESETWLTRLSGLLTRNRYDLALPLKQAAGLCVPLTGDGSLLGRQLLARHPWRPESLTEGWDLYVRLTLAGERVELARSARIYAQETRSLEQAATQRARWSAGRGNVLRENWKRIFNSGMVSWHQKLDLFAELSTPGPVLTVLFAFVGLLLSAIWLPGGLRPLFLVAFAVPLIHQAMYSLISLARHPDRWAVLAAAVRLPGYAAWRLALATRLLFGSKPRVWTRTARHEERPPV